MLTLPFPHLILPDFGSLLSPISVAIAEGIARLCGLNAPRLQEITSDTTLMYVHVGWLTVVAGIGSLVWGVFDQDRKSYERLSWGVETAMRYYVAAFMLIYGFSKVFKWQFYLPEPNTLYTPMGEVPRDLLFWSTMGVSRGYVVFSGILEVLAGGLLLFRKSSLAGAMLAIGVMVNVVAINFCFDISVKLFSLFLLVLCGMMLLPHAQRTVQFLMGKAVAASVQWRPNWKSLRWKWLYPVMKSMVIVLIVWDATGLYVASGIFNDDVAPRLAGHGAYEVEEFVLNDDTLEADVRSPQRWRRVFIHRRGYFITQGMNDELQDYLLRADAVRKVLIVAAIDGSDSTELEVTLAPSHAYSLRGMWGRDTLALRLRALDWRGLPLLRGDFNWTSDKLE
jgi:hypothetical protein